MEDDWDLHAVVRSCSSTITVSSSAATATTSSQTLSNFEQDCSFSDSLFIDPLEPRRSSSFAEDLNELWKPFFPKQQIFPISPLSALQDLPSDHQQHQQAIKKLPQQKQQLFSIVNRSKSSSTSHHPSPRPKKRKNHSKKVCHVAVENLSSDMWSWRKYGQKPIKGSPYPRGYYRCSTSKGCTARKQVERNRSDPGMFIVTYTGDHSHPMPTHRNSLAGSTRQKPAADDPKKPSSSPPPEKQESSREDFEEDDEDEDFFAGLEDFTGDCLSDSEHLQFPWLANNSAAVAATTTTAAGGS